MLQDAHSRKVAIPVEAPVGDTVIVAGTDDRWIYVHEIIGDMDGAGQLEIVAINPTTSDEIELARQDLDQGQGITLQDEPGEDNRPRFEFPPGYDFVIRCTGAAFDGSVHYSLRY